MESYIIATTDSNGNIYTEFSSNEYVIVSQWCVDTAVSLILTGSYFYAFHCGSYNNVNIGDNVKKTIYYRYYKK